MNRTLDQIACVYIAHDSPFPNFQRHLNTAAVAEALEDLSFFERIRIYLTVRDKMR